MKRQAEQYLKKWKASQKRKPLILRGARQVGKTHIVNTFGDSFPSFVELNFEKFPKAKAIFEKDLDVKRLLRDLSIFTKKEITPGKTLLFFDEVQVAPQAIASLRYFYEELPDLHVIAAGSLIDFHLDLIGIPVGRVSFLYLYPLSFIEFLEATKGALLTKTLQNLEEKELENNFLYHDTLIESVAHYMAIGGMPEVVETWVNTEDIKKCRSIQYQITEAYKQDFNKYANSHQLKYVDLIFQKVPQTLSHKVNFSHISQEFRARELAPCFDLLEKAGVIHKVWASKAQAPPLGASVNPKHFKSLFLDVGLSQAILGVDVGDWILNPESTFSNKGALTEAFVGQELLAYADPTRKASLYYWLREKSGSSAELDYVIQKNDKLIPIEVKSGRTGGLKSLTNYLKNTPNSTNGIHFSQKPFEKRALYTSYPLYLIKYLFNED